MEPKTTKYECSKCHAEDSDRGNTPPAPAVLICWNCGAGRGCTSLAEMVQRGIGMFPIEAEA